MKAKIYCCCKEADELACEKCGKAQKIGAYETVIVDKWPRVRHVHKPYIAPIKEQNVLEKLIKHAENLDWEE